MSNSRLEKFIYAICSMEVSDLPAPLSRIEILWNCLITGETPDFEPQSRNEQYLMAMLGLYELENLPAPMSRGEKLLYKIAMGETDLSDIPAYLSRYEELLGYLAENGGVGDFEYILQTLNQRLSTLYSTKERPMKQAVIKGDTLVNELPRPSLKNTMMNTASQKLNQGYDNGKTLVNLISNDKIVFQKAPTDIWIDTPSNTATNRCSISIKNIKPNTRYIIKTLSETKQLYLRMFNTGSNATDNRIGWININSIFTTSENTEKIIISFRISENNEDYTDISQCSNILLLEYQDGMENWDIPYFEGTKTFSATPNVVDGEFKQAVVKGNTILWDNVCNEEVSNSDSPLDIWVGYGTINQSNGVMEESTVDFPTYFLEIPSNLAYIKGTATWKKIFYYNAEKEYISCQITIADTSDLRVIIPDNAVYMRLQYYKPENDLTFYLTDSDGNEIKIVRNISMQSVQLSEVTTTGKNLFDKENVVNGIFMSGSLSTQSTNTNLTNGKDNAIKVEPNTCYTFSFATGWKVGALGLNATKTAITIDTKWQTNSAGYTFVTDENTHYVTFNIGRKDNADIKPSDKDNLQLMLEKGSVATPYEPYQSNTLTLAEPVTLRKVGDVEDTFDALTGQVTERVGEVVLDGVNISPIQNHMSDQNNTIGFDFKKSFPLIDSAFIYSLNDTFPDYDGEYLYHNDIEGVARGWDAICVRINKNRLTQANVEGFKQWLQTNPITVQYFMPTESTKTVNTTITNQDGATQTKLHSFNDGHLSVSSQGLLPSAVDYEVPTNNSYYLPDMLTLGAQYTARGSADCNATIDGKLLALGANRTFTTPSSLTNRLMVLDAPVDDLMFIKGDQTAKDFGYFEGMKSVVLSNKMPVLTTTGKNLFYSALEYGDFNNSTGIPNNTAPSIIRTKEYNEISPNKTYCLNVFNGIATLSTCVVHEYDDNFDYIKSTNSNVFTTSANTKYIKFRFRKFDNSAYTKEELSVLSCMITEGNTIPTTYEPYKSNILTVNEPVELRGVGDIKDTLNLSTGELHLKLGSKNLSDEDIQWIMHSSWETDVFMTFGFETTLGGGLLCNNFIKGDSGTVMGTERAKRSFYAHDACWFVTINKSELSEVSVQGFKEWLNTNPTFIIYKLPKESIKTVDLTTVDQDGQPTKLKTFNDISHVEINSDNIIPSVDVEIATKINETLATLDPQQLNISNTQNQLGQTIDEQTENTDATMMATTEIYEQTL